jgi:hypothetical protein
MAIIGLVIGPIDKQTVAKYSKTLVSPNIQATRKDGAGAIRSQCEGNLNLSHGFCSCDSVVLIS